MFLLNRAVAPAAAAAAIAAGSAFAQRCFATVDCEANTTASQPVKQPLRCLITGFHDWRELENNVWRCRDNPACRLLLGPPSDSPPLVRKGPLVRALQHAFADGSVEFTFQTLPVTWNTAAGLDLMLFDVVVHLGLGVYDCHDTILLEQDAYNLRCDRPDALANLGGGKPIVAPYELAPNSTTYECAPMQQRFPTRGTCTCACACLVLVGYASSHSGPHQRLAQCMHDLICIHGTHRSHPLTCICIVWYRYASLASGPALLTGGVGTGGIVTGRVGTDGGNHAAFKLERADARHSNTYICNETHFRALKAVERAAADRESDGMYMYMPRGMYAYACACACTCMHTLTSPLSLYLPLRVDTRYMCICMPPPPQLASRRRGCVHTCTYACTYTCAYMHPLHMHMYAPATAASQPAPRLRAGYFVHLPYESEHMGGYEGMATAVAELIGRLCRVEVHVDAAAAKSAGCHVQHGQVGHRHGHGGAELELETRAQAATTFSRERYSGA